MGIYYTPDGLVSQLQVKGAAVFDASALVKGAAIFNASAYVTGPFQGATAGQIDGLSALGDASTDVLKFFGIGSGTSQSALIANSATVIETNTARINTIVALLKGYGLTATA